MQLNIKLSPVQDFSLAINFQGCNFNCPYCYNKDLLSMNYDDAITFQDLKNHLEDYDELIQEVILTGGEPTLQKNTLFYICKLLQYKNKFVVLHTNGSKPNIIKTLVNSNLVDKIVLDIKAITSEQFEKITKSKTFFTASEDILIDIKKTLFILKDANIEVEVVTPIIPGYIYRKEQLIEIAQLLDEYDRHKWTLQSFRNDLGDLNSKLFNNVNSPNHLESLQNELQKKFKNLEIKIF